MRSRKRTAAAIAAIAANCEARTAAIAIPCRAPIAYEANPVTSARPPTTTSGTALRVRRSLPARASGTVTKRTPSSRGGSTAQAIGSSRLARPVA